MPAPERGIDCDASAVIELIRHKLFQSGAHGCEKIAICFAKADENGTRRLDNEEFEEVLTYCGIFLARSEVNQLFNYYDTRGDRRISLGDLYSDILGTLNERRNNVVESAFDKVSNNLGDVSLEQILRCFCASQHPRVLMGHSSEQAVTQQLLDSLGALAVDGQITIQDFHTYYTSIGGVIPADEVFIRLVETSWGLSENRKAEEGKVNNYVQTLNEKCRQKAKGKLSVKNAAINIFQFFDEDESGSVSRTEFAKAMERMGCPGAESITDLVFQRFDVSRDGKLDIDEFVRATFE